jgi:hypothetical protein
MRKLGLVVVVLLGACFDPSEPLCNFKCGPANECPDDYTCLPDGYCHLHGAAGACGYSDLSVPDLAEPPDMFNADQTVVESCTDGIKNGSETGIDCGGGACPKCALGKTCASFADGARDCESGRCSAVDKVCVATACADQTMNNAETDVDCGGGTCPACAVGKMCAGLAEGPRDCTSMVCSATGHVCVAAAGCADQVKDNLETDVDCGGGGCATCALSQMCGGLANGVRDCASGVCSATGMVCVANACLDQAKDGAETDIDCGGGACPTCATTKACLIGADCTSTFCAANSKVCVATQCLDEAKNGTETDVDCGGATCNKCGNGKDCLISGDCTSTFCSATGKKCVATQCQDQTKNGTETDVDCGGATCNKCGNGLACLGDADCTSGICSTVSKLCVATRCQDEQKNNAETDVDCGGGTCPKCADGKGCAATTDCVNYCSNVTNKCQTSSCPDGIKNGTEADTDCGAPTSSCPTQTCGTGATCTADNQCTNGTCVGSTTCN